MLGGYKEGGVLSDLRDADTARAIQEADCDFCSCLLFVLVCLINDRVVNS